MDTQTLQALTFLAKETDPAKRAEFISNLPPDGLKALKMSVKELFPSAGKERSPEQLKAEAALQEFEKEYADVLKEHSALRAEVKKYSAHLRVATEKYSWVLSDGTSAKAGSGYVKVMSGKLSGKVFNVVVDRKWVNLMVNDGGFTDGQVAAIDKAMRAARPVLVKAV